MATRAQAELALREARRDRGVVEEAEAHRPVRQRVVSRRAGEGEASELHRLDRGAGRQQRRLVGGLRADRVRVEQGRVSARGDDAHRLDVVDVVHGGELGDRRRAGLDEVRIGVVERPDALLAFGMAAGRVRLGERPMADERDHARARTCSGRTSAGVGQPRRRQREPDLGLEELEHVPRSLLAACGEPPEGRPPDQHGLRAERERLDHVGPPAHAAVEEDLGPAGDRLHDLGQGVEGRGDPVELAPSVIGDDDAGAAVLTGEQRVLGREDALDQQRQRALLAQPLEVAPGEARVHDLAERVVEVLVADERARQVGHGEVGGEAEAAAEVALARARPWAGRSSGRVR